MLPPTEVSQEQIALETLIPLNEDERLNAREQARELVKRKYPKPTRQQYDTAGPIPDRKQYDKTHISDYPNWVTKTIGVMLLIAFVGAFLTSAFNVFSAGRNHFAGIEAMRNGAGVEWQAVVVGVAIVLLSEFLTITSTLAARIYFRGQRLQQLLMLLPIVAGVVMAVVANAVIARPAAFWEWLLTVTPPASVVFLALIGEQIILVDVRRSHANEKAYQQELMAWKAANQADEKAYAQAVREWEKLVTAPEKTPLWNATYANQLREQIRRVNSNGRGQQQRREFMQTMTAPQWSAVVIREMRADNWFTEDTPVPFGQQAPAEPPLAIRPTPALPEIASLHTGGNGTNGKLAY